MTFEIEIVTLVLTLSSIIVTLQIIPKVHSDIVLGWRWVVLALLIFAAKQILNIYEKYEYGPILELLFIIFLTIGLSTHLIKIMQNYRPPQNIRRRV
jgi:hypothetical protein